MRVSEKYCPWNDKELKGLMRTRDKLKKSAVKSKSSLIMDSYRQVRNKVNALNIRRKKEYYTNKISACKRNVKESWKTINELLNKKSNSSSIDSLAGSGSDTVPKEDIPDVMNSYFSSVGKELTAKISATPNALLSGNFKVNKTNAKFHFRTSQLQEIRDAFAKVKTAKSFGVDNILSFFLKLALPSIENSLALLFNTYIETSVFPDLWKIASITPILKEGDKVDKSNYRPISVLPIIARLFEKLVANQVYQHMVDNNLFTSGQSTYRSLHSTVTHLLKNTDDWYSGLDLNKLVGLTFIDLKKAFDTVDHEILCKKLEHYGIQQRELTWFRSYLFNRKQFCRVNGISSKLEKIDVGVPQGSCLGPLLFLIYINDLPHAVQNYVVSMYADDTSLCYQASDIETLNEAIINDLIQLETWLKGNKLSLNVAKPNSMLISTKQKHKILKNRDEDLQLTIRNKELEVIQKTKYLGVTIDNSLNWKEHIKTVSTKVSKAIGFLRHSKTFLPQETLKTLYKGIVEPHFRYCCSIWGCAGSNELNQLQELQYRAARILTNGSVDTPGRLLIDRFGWKTIDRLIAEGSKTMVYKSMLLSSSKTI